MDASTQTPVPEALRIAAALEYCDASVARQAINELKRLHGLLMSLDELVAALTVSGATYAPLPKKPAGLNRSTLSFVYSEKQMRDFADATHALRVTTNTQIPK